MYLVGAGKPAHIPTHTLGGVRALSEVAVRRGAQAPRAVVERPDGEARPITARGCIPSRSTLGRGPRQRRLPFLGAAGRAPPRTKRRYSRMVQEAFPQDVYARDANEADEVERVRGFKHFALRACLPTCRAGRRDGAAA
jgi:hypothetical protein